MDTQLDSTKWSIVLSDETHYECDIKFVHQFKTFSNMIDDLGDDDKKLPLTLDYANSQHFDILQEFYISLGQISFVLVNENKYNFSEYQDKCDKFVNQYLHTENKELNIELVKQLIALCNFLDYKIAYNFFCWQIALVIEDYTPEQIAKLFGLTKTE